MSTHSSKLESSHASSPQATPRFYSIQILRGLAAVLVILHHQSQAILPHLPPSPVIDRLSNGAFGVDIFFPISGFVMYLTASSILRRGNVSGAWKDFLWRRFLRVAPLYWFFTVLKLTLVLAIPVAAYRFKLWHAIASFLFLPAYNNSGDPAPILGIGWTLSYEMFFYTIVALAIAFRLPLLRWCSVIIIPLAIVGIFIPHHWGGLTFLADPIELEFLTGMCIAALIDRPLRIPPWVLVIIASTALAFAFLYPLNSGQVELTPFRVLIWGIPGALLVWSIVQLEKTYSFARRHWLLLLGDASFSLYLIHTFIITATHSLIPRLLPHGAPGIVLFYVIGCALSIAAAIPFHLYVELPLLSLLTRKHLPWSLRTAETPPSIERNP